MKPINILFLFVLLFPAALPAQETGAAMDCDAPLPRERIVLHTDRSLYLVGEEIWFKAYCLLNGQPSDKLSKVLYVELFNAEKKVLIQQKFRIQDGIATGALDIPEEVLSGRHFLRAYTQYLRNFTPENFAYRLLAIVHPVSPPPDLMLPRRDSLSFLLADKELVAGLPTRLIASFDPALCTEKERITLQNERGETLANCSALYEGHALFNFTPATGTGYRAVVRMNNGELLQKSLPPAQNAGLSCQAEIEGNNLTVTLHRPPGNGSSVVPLRIFSEDRRLLDSRRIEMQGINHRFTTPADKLAPGIYYIVVGQAGEKEPQVYPFYYAGPPALPVKLTADQGNYAPREEVSLSIEPPAKAHCLLSVSVRKKGLGADMDSFPAFLWSNPWLLPSYLADGYHWEEKQLEMALMLLGGQLNKGGQLFSSEKTALRWIPEIRGLTLSGLMRTRESQAPAAGEISMAGVVGSQPQIHMTETRSDGSFIFTLHGLEGLQNLFVGWKGAGGTPPEILINDNFSNRFPSVAPVPLVFEAEQHRLFEALYVQAQLNTAFEPDKEENAFAAAPPMTPVTNIGKPDHSIVVANFVTLPSLEEVFREIIPYVLVRREKGKALLDVYNENTQQAYDNPLVLLDNIPVFNIGRLLEINPGSIEKIEVYNTNYLLGDYLFGGLVSVHTNTDDFAGYQWTEPAVFVRFPAISPSVAFQHPVYPSGEARSSTKPDFRPSLYWNPAVETGEKPASLEFYTSSLEGTYEIIVRGFTREGRPCFGRTLIEVGEER